MFYLWKFYSFLPRFLGGKRHSWLEERLNLEVTKFQVKHFSLWSSWSNHFWLLHIWNYTSSFIYAVWAFDTETECWSHMEAKGDIPVLFLFVLFLYWVSFCLIYSGFLVSDLDLTLTEIITWLHKFWLWYRLVKKLRKSSLHTPYYYILNLLSCLELKISHLRKFDRASKYTDKQSFPHILCIAGCSYWSHCSQGKFCINPFWGWRC